MKTQMSRVNRNLVLTMISLLCVIVAHSAYSGFEIGNGRKLLKNDLGNYKMVIPEKLEVGKANKLTEAISPISEGTPRTRLQINVIKNAPQNSLTDAMELMSDSPNLWKPITLGGMQGIRSEVVTSTGTHQIEINLFSKTNEVVVINIEGVPMGAPSASYFEELETNLKTFDLLKK